MDAKSGIYPEVLRYEALSLMKIDIYISIFVVYLCSMINTFSFFLGDLKGSLIEDVCDIGVELVFIFVWSNRNRRLNSCILCDSEIRKDSEFVPSRNLNDSSFLFYDFVRLPRILRGSVSFIARIFDI